MNSIRFILLSALLLCGFNNLYSQRFAVDKGVWMLDGSLTLGAQRSMGTRTVTLGTITQESSQSLSSIFITASPSIGYFVSPNIMIGGQANLSGQISFNNQGNSTDVGQNTILLGPRVGYYYGNSESKFYPFVTVAALYGRSEATSTLLGGTGSGIVNLTQLNIIGNLGVAYMVAKNLAVTGGIFYSSASNSGSFLGRTIDYPTVSSVGIQFGVAGFIF